MYLRPNTIPMKAPTQAHQFDPIPENPLEGDLDKADLEPRPPEPKRMIEESRGGQMKSFEKEIWGTAGVIKESRLLEGKLLALVHVSKELQTLASDSEQEIQNSGYDAKSPKKDGLYLVLKTHGGLSYFGGRHADKMDPVTLDIAYRNLEKVREFVMFTMEIEDAVDAREKYEEDLRARILSKKGGEDCG